jgi:hypothetical protein
LKIKNHILIFLLVLVTESCQNHEINKINPIGDIVFDDFKGFPNKPFVQISFSNSSSDNQSTLLNNGFINIGDNSYYRPTDSITIFSDSSFENFTVYLKSQKFLNQSQLLYDLIESQCLKLIGTPIFTEFKIELTNGDKYSLTFFKTITFIRLNYQFINPKG